MVFGFILAIGIALTLPYLALGAAHSGRNSGRFRAPTRSPKQSFSQPFHRFGRFGEVGAGGPQVTIIQFQPPATTEAREPSKNGIYVPPQWVDVGHGVQVLKPGYWIDPKQAAER